MTTGPTDGARMAPSTALAEKTPRWPQPSLKPAEMGVVAPWAGALRSPSRELLGAIVGLVWYWARDLQLDVLLVAMGYALEGLVPDHLAYGSTLPLKEKVVVPS